jgi:hypothetical protein
MNNLYRGSREPIAFSVSSWLLSASQNRGTLGADLQGTVTTDFKISANNLENYFSKQNLSAREEMDFVKYCVCFAFDPLYIWHIVFYQFIHNIWATWWI